VHWWNYWIRRNKKTKTRVGIRILPESVIKISGGRETNLDDSGEELLQSGANGIITAGYLTMTGNEAKKDLEMIERIGLRA
jgi:biotin synthase